jgi:hypothetical protein
MQRRQDDDTVHAAAIVLAAAARATSTGLQRHQQQLDGHASCAAAVRYILVPAFALPAFFQNF